MLKYDEQLSMVFRAIGDPGRRAILEQLSRGPASVSELAEPLPMSLAAVHQHLAVLQDSGLIRSEKVGRVRTCHLEVAKLDNAESWIESCRATWVRRLDRLDTYLTNLPPETRSDDVPKKGQHT